MNLAPCPNCGLPTDAKYGRLETVEWAIVGWRCMCIRCGYSGPACQDLGEAVRRHNKMAQNCGSCIPSPPDIVGHVKRKCGHMNKMKPFSKLFASIVTSSIWTEDAETRVVWVTMLAICDADGDVWASVGGLAKAAGVSRDVCAAALAKFLAPDLDSRTKEHEGRRIEEIDGGWRLLNYRKYRELGRTEDRRQYFAAKKRESRAAMSKHVHKCPQRSTMSPIAEADAEADAKTELEAAASPPPYTPVDRNDSVPNAMSAAAMMFMSRTWMDWKLEVGRHRVYIDREGNSEAHWAALYNKSGWEEFAKAWEYCAGRTQGKVFLANMLEVLK